MRAIALTLALLFLAAGCATSSEQNQNFLRTELYFAIALQGESEAATVARGGLGETGWIKFVDEVVTPLFPDGLSVFHATGQWLSDRFETPPKLDTRVIVILHPDTAEADARIEQIRADYLALTGQQSVLRVTQAANVSF